MARSQNNIEANEKPLIPEQKLWKAVLLLAIEDAFGNNKSEINRYEKQVARDWMKDFTIDFAIVCENAGFNPKQAFYKFKKYNLIQKGIVNER